MAEEATTSPFQDPAEKAREEAERLHKIAFPESYEETETPEESAEGENPGDESALEPEVDTALAEQATHDDDNADYWRQRFEVMAGKYNAEVPRMADQIRQLTEQMNDLASRSTPQAKETVDPVSAAFARISETYGDDLAKDFLELAQAAAQSTTKETLQPVEQELAQVRQTSTKTAQQAFEDALTQKVPNWRTSYTDPKFADFLIGNREPLTGATYETLFVHANNNWDLDRIATFFQMFNEQTGTTTNPATPSTAPQRRTPEHLVTPSRKGGGMQTQMTNAGGQVYTSKQIADFYQDVRDGKYRGQDAKIRQMKAEFNKAAVEGRVVG